MDPREAENLESRHLLYLNKIMKAKLLLPVISLITLQAALAQSTNPTPYCDATFDDAQGFWVEDYIGSVSFGTLKNVSNGQHVAPHYVYYNSLNLEKFTINKAYDLNVSFEVKGGCGYGVWIDYNQNNTFEPNEKIAGTAGNDILDLGSNITIAKSITIPADAKPGKTRMRVRIVEDDNFIQNTSEILPCNASNSSTDIMDWGETEDYDIEIVDDKPNSIATMNATANFELFPNPSTTSFTIASKENINQVIIYNQIGQVVYSNNQLNKTNISIDNNFPTGIYIVKITIGEVSGYQKLQIAK